MIRKSRGKGQKHYKCPHCGEKWVGVTNRVAKRPLNPEAVAFANGNSYQTCPFITNSSTGEKRRIDLSSDDYLCRRKWMDAYLSHAEPEEEKRPDERKPDPCDPVGRCPEEEKVAPDVKCALQLIFGSCEHMDKGMRVAFAGEVLEVVPGSTYGSDHIELTAEVQKRCGKHPIWTITDQSEKKGDLADFSAEAPITAKLWLPSIDPRVYTVQCQCCAGSTLQLGVHAYPPNKFGVNLDLKKSLEVLRKVLSVAEAVLDTIADRFQWKFLEGKISAEGSWKEDEEIFAYYGYKIAVAFSPLIGAEFKVGISPLKILNFVRKIPKIGKYIKKIVDWLIKAQIYFKMSGGIECDLKWERDSPAQPKFVENLGTGLGGKIEAALGLEGALIGDDLIKIELEAGGGIVASTDPFIREQGFGLGKMKVDFDGIKGTFKFIFLWGIIDVSESVTLVEATTLWGPEDVWIYEETN